MKYKPELINCNRAVIQVPDAEEAELLRYKQAAALERLRQAGQYAPDQIVLRKQENKAKPRSQLPANVTLIHASKR